MCQAIRSEEVGNKIMSTMTFRSREQCKEWLGSSERSESELLDAQTWGALLELGSYDCVRAWLGSSSRILECYDVNQLFRDAAYFSEDEIAWGLFEEFADRIPDDAPFRALVRSCFLRNPDGSPPDSRQRNAVLTRLSIRGKDVGSF